MSFHLLLAHSHCLLGNGCKSLRNTIYLTPVTVLFTSFQIHICPANLDPASLSENFYPIQKHLGALGIIALYLQTRKLLLHQIPIVQPIHFQCLRESGNC